MPEMKTFGRFKFRKREKMLRGPSAAMTIRALKFSTPLIPFVVTVQNPSASEDAAGVKPVTAVLSRISAPAVAAFIPISASSRERSTI